MKQKGAHLLHEDALLINVVTEDKTWMHDSDTESMRMSNQVLSEETGSIKKKRSLSVATVKLSFVGC